MARYLARRLLLMAATMAALSIVCFAIIQLPPGDFLSARLAEMAGTGDTVDVANVAWLRAQYGLDEPFIVQYWLWISGVVGGDLGFSFELRMPVAEVIGERLGISLTVEILAIIVLWAIAVPVGVYSAVRQYSIGDMAATLFGFIGLAIPNFLLALLLMYLSYIAFGVTIGGLFSPEYVDALVGRPAARFPRACLGARSGHRDRWCGPDHPHPARQPPGRAGAGPMSTLARAKGVAEWRLILRYPVRVAMNPLGQHGRLAAADHHLELDRDQDRPQPADALTDPAAFAAGAGHAPAGGLILLIGVLTLLGTLLSDILLAWLDPRIRLG
ncbi:MAG: ABC transporter permease [Geminicoccaceae bacterium]